MSITVADGRTLIPRRRITLVDGQIEVFLMNVSTGFPELDDAGVVRHHHWDGLCANLCRGEIKRFVVIAE